MAETVGSKVSVKAVEATSLDVSPVLVVNLSADMQSVKDLIC